MKKDDTAAIQSDINIIDLDMEKAVNLIVKGQQEILPVNYIVYLYS